jgi:hypothetical protein
MVWGCLAHQCVGGKYPRLGIRFGTRAQRRLRGFRYERASFHPNLGKGENEIDAVPPTPTPAKRRIFRGAMHWGGWLFEICQPETEG